MRVVVLALAAVLVDALPAQRHALHLMAAQESPAPQTDTAAAAGADALATGAAAAATGGAASEIGNAAADAGAALLADGALRWNRKRRRQDEDELTILEAE